MKKKIVLLALAGFVLAMAPAAQAAIIKVDNRNAAPSVAGWNVADDVANSPFVFGGFTFTYTGDWNMSGYEAEGAFDGTFWDDVATDRFYVNSGDTGSIAISGLNDALTYNLQLVGSDDNSGRAGDYKVNDSFGDVAGPLGGDGYDARLNGYDSADAMTFSNVSPSSGVITITVTPEGNSPAILGAFTIEEVTVPAAVSPADEDQAVDPFITEFSWPLPEDPNVVTVWFEAIDDTDTPIVDAVEGATSVNLAAAGIVLAEDTDYTWRIEIIDPNDGNVPVVLSDEIYTFKTLPPYDGCQAAKDADPPYTETDARVLGDTNYDCKVDSLDLAAMAENWLTNVSD